ncbi:MULTISPECIES: YMGG-like glycine zipper-containing protein [unclassified Roseovarius]|uniref:YMGG-like glycine zipper-containing protein n=1 Tax=unclassified Roseovarius TaxID=2614913 RepID=UPI00273E109C|nr:MULTISPECIES: YMGG-like glycine zipper-containing protein [unclassified Roseovarius]
MASFVTSCGVVGGTNGATSPSGIPTNYLTESAVCDAVCVDLRENLELKRIARVRTNYTIQGAAIGAALGCGVGAILGSSEDCGKGAAAGAIVGGAVGNSKGKTLERERLAALAEARAVAAALQREAAAIARARRSMRTLAHKRRARLAEQQPIPYDEASAYRTDLLLASKTIGELEKTQNSIRKYRSYLKENNVSSTSLEVAADYHSKALSAFRDDFLTERGRYEDFVVANTCLTVSDQTEEEEYTPIPLPGCAPNRV